jgi:alpha-D-ribose 1-methylphosphonate 5-triphosphate synthase subunit PhnH
MSFNPVHDTQTAYRVLLDCMARPGTVGNLAEVRDCIEFDAPLDKGLLLMGLTLLDGETSFTVPTEGVPESIAETLVGVQAFLARICSSRIEDPGRAAFLFLPGGAAVQAIEKAFRGTFIDPHLGATIILELASLGTSGAARGTEPGFTDSTGPDGSWILEGPGIAATDVLSCGPDDARMLSEALSARERACSEFPLGVDLVLVDKAARVVCIPRTTTVREA